MATTFVSGNRTFAQPGIDGGEFSAAAVPANTVIIARMRDVEAFLIGRAVSTGEAGVAVSEPQFSRFNTLTSSGAFVPAGALVGNAVYDWMAIGLGG